MIHFIYDLPHNPYKGKQRTFATESEMRAYIQANNILYGERNWSYCWCWTTLEAQRTQGFNGESTPMTDADFEDGPLTNEELACLEML